MSMGQQAFGFRLGTPRVDGFAISLLSFSDAPVTICRGSFKKTLTASDWTAVGLDAPEGSPAFGTQLGFMADTVITNQKPFERIPLYVTQNGVTYEGSGMTAPEGRGHKYHVPFTSCDTAKFGSKELAGGYKFIKEDYDAGETILAIAHADDHYGYLDSQSISDTGEGGTGHESSAWGAAFPNAWPQETGVEYDYALLYFHAFGLFVNSVQGDEAGPDNWGQDETRIWMMRNINVIPQWGDHDCGANEMGWQDNLVPANNNPSFVIAKTLWDLHFKPLQPDTLSNRATGNHHSVNFGALTIVSPDGISFATGDATNIYANDNFGPTDVYSFNQIDDCLDGYNTDSPFKLGLLNYSFKFMHSAPSKFWAGAQNPLKTARVDEFRRFYTKEDDTVNPLSIMANPKTNGEFGTTVLLCGDCHNNQVYHHESPAFAGHHAENIYTVTVGTNNGSINFGGEPELVAGYQFDGSTIEVFDTTVKNPITGIPFPANGGNDWWGIDIVINDTVHPPEMIITDKDKTGKVLWQKKFIQYRGGNYAFDMETESGYKMNAGATGVVGLGVASK